MSNDGYSMDPCFSCMTRNRYSKLQPLVDRMNVRQSSHAGTNFVNPPYMTQFDERGIDCYARQLQKGFANLSLTTSMQPGVTKQQTYGELWSSKICAALFNQPGIFPVTNIDLRTELLDILYCIFYIMWSPIIFFTRLLFTFGKSSLMILYDISRSSTSQGAELNQCKAAEKCSEDKTELNNCAENNFRDTQRPDLEKFSEKRSSDFNSRVSRKIDHSFMIGRANVENKKNQQSQQCMGKNRYVNDENHFQQSPRHRDISSVELSSDCLLEKYSRREFDNKNCKKRFIRQYRDLVCGTGRKVSHSTPRNPSFHGSKTVSNSKRQIEGTNSTQKSELKYLLKNLDALVPEASEFSRKKLEKLESNESKRFDFKQLLGDCDSSTTETEGTTNEHRESFVSVVNDLKKKSSEKSRPNTSNHIPLRPTLDSNYNNKEDEKSDFHCDTSVDLKDNSVVFEIMDSDSKKNGFQNGTVNPTTLAESNTETLVPLSGAEPLILRYDMKLNTIEKSDPIPENSKQVSKCNRLIQGNVSKKEGSSNQSSVRKLVERDSLESENTPENLGSERRAIGSGNRLKSVENGSSKIAEFSKPIDAKSKWLEMKKKFYGKDYIVAKAKPEKPETKNLPRISSMSKLPAHKIFQYNMLVGRARQMGAEPPSEDIFLEKKNTSSCINASPGSYLKKNEPSSSLLVIPASRCLSQTLSLSQWPSHSGSSSRSKKYSTLESKPKPKPRNERGFNPSKPPIVGRSIAHFPQSSLARPNSCVSSADIRTVNLLQTNLCQMSNGHDQSSSLFPFGFDALHRDNRASLNRSKPLPQSQHVKNSAGVSATKNTNLENEHPDNTDSLISFH